VVLLKVTLDAGAADVIERDIAMPPFA